MHQVQELDKASQERWESKAKRRDKKTPKPMKREPSVSPRRVQPPSPALVRPVLRQTSASAAAAYAQDVAAGAESGREGSAGGAAHGGREVSFADQVRIWGGTSATADLRHAADGSEASADHQPVPRERMLLAFKTDLRTASAGGNPVMSGGALSIPASSHSAVPSKGKAAEDGELAQFRAGPSISLQSANSSHSSGSECRWGLWRSGLPPRSQS